MRKSEEVTLVMQLCLGCSAKLRPQDRFCSNCGTPLKSIIPAAPAEARKDARSDDDGTPLIKPGDIFDERFNVIEKIGSGGMGDVYLVEEEGEELQLALKVLRREFAKDAAAKSRFEREIRILARIRHPSIPRILGWGTQDDSMFFVTEFIEGNDLGEIISSRGILPASEVVPLMISVAEALGSAHQAGVIHRDLKPTNIMISDTGNVYLIDFGVARTVSAELTRLTETGLFVGTPQYMSPEQLDSRQADERSDIYSMGVVLFELLTGKLPFSGDTPIAIAAKHLNEQPPSPRLVAPSVPFWLERIVLRCMEKDPTSRFWTVNELLTELRKSHEKARRRKRVLPNGDTVIEDPSGRNGWVLSISTDREKRGWGAGITLYYRDAFYRISSQRSPNKKNPQWEYFFDLWPDSEVMRRVVDYEAEVSMQSAEGSIFSRARRWISRDL